MLLTLTPLLLSLALAPAGQEAALRQFFEGKTVRLKIDLPGDVSGVDVFPDAPVPVHLPDVEKRLQRFPTALRAGDAATVTLIKVKDNLIEFHLSGGGFGTLRDYGSLPPSSPESDLEKQIRSDLARAKDPALRRALQRQLDAARRHRLTSAATAKAASERARMEQSRRETSGSRFNLRYPNGVPPAALVPARVMEILAPYVEFSTLKP